MTAIKKIPFVLFLFLGASIFTFSACSNSTSGEHDEHEEADGFRIYAGGDILIEQLPDESLSGAIELVLNEAPTNYTIRFISHDGGEFQPGDEEYNLSHEFSDLGIATFSASSSNRWQFSLEGTETGNSELTLFLNHGDHADFTTQTIPVTVVQGN